MDQLIENLKSGKFRICLQGKAKDCTKFGPSKLFYSGRCCTLCHYEKTKKYRENFTQKDNYMTPAKRKQIDLLTIKIKEQLRNDLRELNKDYPDLLYDDADEFVLPWTDY